MISNDTRDLLYVYFAFSNTFSLFKLYFALSLIIPLYFSNLNSNKTDSSLQVYCYCYAKIYFLTAETDEVLVLGVQCWWTQPSNIKLVLCRVCIWCWGFTNNYFEFEKQRFGGSGGRGWIYPISVPWNTTRKVCKMQCVSQKA